ncbi:hypothetical protein A1Q1_00838 [Trichosporon asahii var. asahii CBS 2479]|uniref:Conserved oligomeric Golgi complex subunit 2 n=1 Tax=Trichosporon asahii var. asahii (strain ATCC 90039 / CBS 2479 / JCM 2466 / KCTC 7840 / NBRC 103889/ NCYC 2677 / UAMH 7654) TaxID=1186058 RepID=J6F447_TRIAS|nr:hypothetical protein A1Q1_00838 [Trichosporon asahii var. asahii CBS 2479]EJT49997.1 hypothetical protein A1Q1_00838 [Trichosporon asahii var. asahii CBS 2479]
MAATVELSEPPATEHAATPSSDPTVNGSAPRASTSSAHSLDLPSLVPLSHDHALLSSATFEVDAFLLSRIHIPLDELRGELRSYLGVLREELVQLINDDYEEFISLGTGMRGESDRLKRLQKPLEMLRGEVEVVRDVLASHQDAVQEKLDERATLREEKALLELLQRLFETLNRAESLDTASDDAERPKAVARLAGEYTQLVYLRNKVQREGCKLAEVAEPRIDKLRSQLNNDLSTLLTTALEAKDEAHIRQCLRTYDVIEAWEDAESVVRDDVETWCRSNIRAAALSDPVTSPDSPVPSARRLKPSTPLAVLYNRVLDQVEVYQPLIKMAQALSAHFDFFSRVLWPEISKSVVDNLGSVIFAAGRPDELHKHYTATHQFLTHFESYAPSIDAVIAVRESPEYSAFERRWQLPVYFQLRWKEIVTAFDSALNSTTGTATSPWHLPQSQAAWTAFQRCWARDIFLPELTHRFWRLSLQIVSRYGLWLSNQLINFKEDEDDATLRFAASAISDSDLLLEKIATLPELVELGVDLPLSLSTTHYAERIVLILQKRCAEPLKLVRSVASQFRASGSKSSGPPAASYFVPQLLKPVHAFFDGRPALKAKYQAAWAGQVAEHVMSNYAQILAQVRKTEDLLRRHRKTRKGGFSLFGSQNAAQDDGADDERFKAQMLADVEGLAADAKSLGVTVDNMASWAELKDVVQRPAE